MDHNEYFLLLLEHDYLSRLMAALQVEEQRTCGQIQKHRHDIHANSKLPKVRHDIATLQGILTVQDNLINSQIEKTYEFKFKSFKANDYQNIIKETQQVQEQKSPDEGKDVRQSEGSEPLSNAGDNEEKQPTGNESGKGGLSVSAGSGSKQQKDL